MENGKTIIIRNLEELTAALAAPADAAAEKLIIDGQRSAFYNEKFYQLPEDAAYRYKASGRNEAFKGIIQFCKENKKSIEGFSNEARTAIASYDWPGNIRELRNCVESAVVMCRTSQIEPSDLPPAVSKARSGNSIEIELGTTMDEAEKKIILGTVAYCKGNKSKAADVLGLGRKTIIRKMQEYEQAAETGSVTE